MSNGDNPGIPAPAETEPKPVEVQPDINPESAELDPTSLAKLAIDQAIVDGLVDGVKRRVHISILISFGFQGARAPKAVFNEFHHELTRDDRFIDKVAKRYGYTPVIEGETEARASPQAIIKGIGIFTDEEKQAVVDLMEFYTEKLYQQVGNTPGRSVLYVREVSGALKAAGLDVGHREHYGFFEHIRHDSRFRMLDGGRIILTGFENPEQNIEIPEEIPKIDDFRTLITDALPYIYTDSSRNFDFGALLGTLKAKGILVHGGQIKELRRQLNRHPDVDTDKDGTYTIADYIDEASPRTRVYENAGDIEDTPPEPSTTGTEHQPSLDEMIKAAIGSGSSGKSSRDKRQDRGAYRKGRGKYD